MTGRNQLGLMKPRAVFDNPPRGPVGDQQALTEALAARRIFAAGIDVFEREPVPAGDPLLTQGDGIVAPHIARASVPPRIRPATLAAENLVPRLPGERAPQPGHTEGLDGE